MSGEIRRVSGEPINQPAPITSEEKAVTQITEKKKAFIQSVNSLIVKTIENEGGIEDDQKLARSNLIKCAVQHKIPLDQLKERVTYFDKLLTDDEAIDSEAGEKKSRSERINSYLDDNIKHYKKSAKKTMIWRIVGLVMGVALTALGIGLTASGLAAGVGVPLLAVGLAMTAGFGFKLYNARAKKYEKERTEEQIKDEEEEVQERYKQKIEASKSPRAKEQEKRIKDLEKTQLEMLELLKAKNAKKDTQPADGPDTQPVADSVSEPVDEIDVQPAAELTAAAVTP